MTADDRDTEGHQQPFFAKFHKRFAFKTGHAARRVYSKALRKTRGVFSVFGGSMCQKQAEIISQNQFHCGARKKPSMKKGFLKNCGRSFLPGDNAGLGVWLGLWKTDDALVWLPLAALFEHFNAFKAFEDVAFCRNRAGTFEAAMLRHDDKKRLQKGFLPRRREVGN